MSKVGQRLNDLLQAGGFEPKVGVLPRSIGYWIRKHGVRFYLPARQLDEIDDDDWLAFLIWWKS